MPGHHRTSSRWTLWRGELSERWKKIGFRGDWPFYPIAHDWAIQATAGHEWHQEFKLFQWLWAVAKYRNLLIFLMCLQQADRQVIIYSTSIPNWTLLWYYYSVCVRKPQSRKHPANREGRLYNGACFCFQPRYQFIKRHYFHQDTADGPVTLRDRPAT